MNQSRKWSSVASPRCSATRSRYQSACHGHRLAIEERLDDDHLPLEAAGLHRARRRPRRRAVRAAAAVAGRSACRRRWRNWSHTEKSAGGHLVAVVGLGGEEATVVDLDRVARLELRHDRGIGRAEDGDVVRRARSPGAGRRPRPPRCTTRSAPRISTSGTRSTGGRPPSRDRGTGRPCHAVSTPPRPGPGCRPTARPSSAASRSGDGGDDLAGVVHDVGARARVGRVVAEVAGLGPEVLEVGGVGHAHAAVEHREGVHAHRAVAEPRAGREPHPGHLERGRRARRRRARRTCRRCRPARRRRRSGRTGRAGPAGRACGR